MTRASLFALLVATAAPLACTSGTMTTTTADGGSNAGTGQSGDGASEDPGTTDGDPTDPASDGEQPSEETKKETKVGTITLTSTAYTIGTTTVEQGMATGTFYRVPPVKGTSSGGGCSTQTIGTCEVTECTMATATSDGGTVAIDYTDAGRVTITGVDVNDGSMTLTPGGYGYQTVSGSVALFSAGATIHMSAPGNPNGAPAWGSTMTAPGSVNVTKPLFDAQSSVAASANADLAVSWTGGAGGNVLVSVASAIQGKSSQTRCVFPAASGKGSVPKAALGSAASVGGQTTLMVMSESRDVQSIDGWNITLSLQSYGVRPQGGGLALGILKLQ
ncbi:hypothetical protein AKJ09_00557 [Labilithrix luteola]|uniref:Uncharacterized protein n=1 Tax=Labilithrix luteola TaxID=1391654 RepID=A0A0K1PK23_9BACT|nr:hypothetical protein [Labilithrix luteola]AKU93893.1 hypothetical protein AKJ09_00557 [Labilithrix luteola]